MRALIPVLVAGLTPFLVLTLIVTGVGLHLVAWQPPLIWYDHFGPPGDFVSNDVTSIFTNGSAVYAVGYVGYGDRPNINPSPSYVFLDRYDTGGSRVWSQKIGNPQSDQVRKMAGGRNGVFLFMVNSGASYVQQYNFAGGEVWSTQYRTGVTQPELSANGNGVYAVTLGAADQNLTSAIILSGYSNGGNLFLNETLGRESEFGSVNVFAGSNGLYVAGSRSLWPTDTQAFVSGYDLNGTWAWTRQFDVPSGFTCFCGITGVSGDSSGLYVTGGILNAFPGQYSSGLGDLFVRKYSWDGRELWTSQISSPDHSGAVAPEISATDSGVYLVYVASALHGFALKYDGTGNLLWSLLLSQYPHAISAGRNGIFVGGSVQHPYGEAFLENISESSSLVLFGLNPPSSFVVAALLVALVAFSILALRRLRKKHHPTSA